MRCQRCGATFLANVDEESGKYKSIVICLKCGQTQGTWPKSKVSDLFESISKEE